jgi:ATP-binding protein involved in chromosome partitioning
MGTHVEIDLASGGITEGRGDGGHGGREPPVGGAGLSGVGGRLHGTSLPGGATNPLAAPVNPTRKDDSVTPSEAEVRAAVEAVVDPDLRRAIGELGIVRSVGVKRRSITVVLAMPVARWPAAAVTDAVNAAVEALGGPGSARVDVVVMTDDERAALHSRLAAPSGAPDHGSGPPAGSDHGHAHAPPRAPGAAPGPLGHEEGRPNRFMVPGTRTRVIGISSGKGGVGKSSVTVNLAVALAARGHEVGLLDADVYGFSVPKMLGVTAGPVAIDELLVPPVVHGVRCLSMGFFVPDEQPVIWRGPMLHNALEQFLGDAYWGEPD